MKPDKNLHDDLLKVDQHAKKSEIFIIGGGIAGRSLACALSFSNVFITKDEIHAENKDPISSITLLDDSGIDCAHSEISLDKAPSANNLIMAPSSIRFLNSLGVLSLTE